jgi:hypothetical protein
VPLSVLDWRERFGRRPKEGVRRLLILWPFGSVMRGSAICCLCLVRVSCVGQPACRSSSGQSNSFWAIAVFAGVFRP